MSCFLPFLKGILNKITKILWGKKYSFLEKRVEEQYVLFSHLLCIFFCCSTYTGNSSKWAIPQTDEVTVSKSIKILPTQTSGPLSLSFGN